MIARLDGQKRVDRAIDAFATVAAAVPDATLDIYGDGELRDQLKARIDAADHGDRITLHGHDPHAREALWTASLFWLTSEFEGYPLSTLEAMSHGVPVVSMDMPYGPREQITDGVDGALVPSGDIAAIAERTIELLRSDLEPMRTAARAKAAAHGHEQFLVDWQRVLERVVELKPSRVQTTSTWYVDSDLDGDPITFDGQLELDHAADDIELVAQAWSPDQAEMAEIPLNVERDESEFSFEGSLSRSLFPPHGQIRVGFVWRNVAEFVPIVEPVRRSARSVIGAALRRIGLRR
jgi:poly(glycerol-phosphate) alpha-glucosyltransferase